MSLVAFQEKPPIPAYLPNGIGSRAGRHFPFGKARRDGRRGLGIDGVSGMVTRLPRSARRVLYCQYTRLVSRFEEKGVGMLILIAAMSAGFVAPGGVDRAIVSSSAGTVAGKSDGAVRTFKGIPYAAPPVGNLRWREPRRAALWRGARRATDFAPACSQVGVSMPGETPPATSEDCLYLNIWTPVRSSRLPVIVWLHGGGFTNGSAAMPLYWGDRLARRGVVVVTVGYRLGPLGYLAHPALTEESPRHTSGNYGLLDQIAALRWVRSNIAAFGGDPSRVTIAGQSAGATSVSLLVASPLAKGLFARAIAQSGGLFEPIQVAPGYRLVRAEQAGVAYAESLGATSLAALRRMPADKLFSRTAVSVSHPVIDRVVLPRTPYDAYTAGTQNDVPILIGSTADEARSLIPNLSSIRAATFDQDITKAWGRCRPPFLPPTLAEPMQRRSPPGLVWSVIYGLAGTCGHGRVCRPPRASDPPFTITLMPTRPSRQGPSMKVGAPAILPTCGICSITSRRRHGNGPPQIAAYRT